jgi:hypothetical protein
VDLLIQAKDLFDRRRDDVVHEATELHAHVLSKARARSGWPDLFGSGPLLARALHSGVSP